jgi:hypothetical protein
MVTVRISKEETKTKMIQVARREEGYRQQS